jgi:hypothetical protein
MKQTIIKTLVAMAILYGTYKMGENQLITSQEITTYNTGYRDGMLYAYDNVVICGASPEFEGQFLATKMGLGNISNIICTE